MPATVHSMSDYTYIQRGRSWRQAGNNPEHQSILTTNEPVSKWVDETFFNLSKLMDLPRNWDDYEAQRIDSANLSTAIRIVHEMAVLGVDYPPTIVPTVTGGVQLEWTAAGSTIELEIVAPYELYYYGNIGELERELEFLSADYSWVDRELASDLQNLYQDNHAAQLLEA